MHGEGVSDLLLPPTAHGSAHVTPQRAGWRYIGFETRRLRAAEQIDIDLRTREAAIIVLSGAVEFESGSERWSGIGSRAGVFDAPPDAVYVPMGDGAHVRGQTDAEIALCFCESDRAGKPIRIDPASIEIETRGDGNASRQIRHVIPPSFPSHRLLVVEVLTPTGNWSSYPPHKHDVDALPDEAELEEIYYHRQHPADGFAFQRVYTDDRSIDETMTVHDGDVVLVPRGYHVVAQAYGYQGYYLNVLAGDRRSMAASDDTPYRWIREQWQRGKAAP
jgi:5-deoxy-glucuronate isomerase